MRRTIIPTAAGLVLIAGAGLAFAQGPDRGGGPGGGSGGGPGSRPHVGPPAGGGPSRSPEMGAPRGASPGPSRGESPGRSGPRFRSESPSTPSRRAEPPSERRESRPKIERDRRAVERERPRTERNVERKRDVERSRAAERERAAREERQAEERRRKSTEQARERRTPDGTGRGKESDRVASKRYDEVRQARTRLSADEHRRLHKSFDVRRARVAKATFNWRVGHRIPRHVRLFPVPREVISFFPYYSSYRYFAVDDEICIVDPVTYEVVDVIDESYRGGPRPQVAGLRLSPAQIAIVRDSIPPDFPTARVRLRLALGAEIPVDVALNQFAVIVLERVPELREYRFVVTADEIVIVEPRDRSIALIVDRA
jgi:hypothetical protein